MYAELTKGSAGVLEAHIHVNTLVIIRGCLIHTFEQNRLDMQFGLFEVLQLTGALGFFIYGMKVMSDGIQKVADPNARDSWCYDIQSGLRPDNRILGYRTGSVVFCHNRNDCEFCECWTP